MSDDKPRTVKEVFDDHLQQAQDGTVEDDFARNYAEDVVLLTGWGRIYHGREGLIALTDLLMKQVPNPRFEYRFRLTERDVAFLEWSARGDGAEVNDGVDSYVIRNGRIVAQTIHYTVRSSVRQHKHGHAKSHRRIS
ncbi:nuclear transport factor 2 family protein [Sphingopyxis sp. SE2]|uniref:nuclear transport factor 2 family protein n=1 Tax=Sphingopyxis sp. SE2 TaxID=1586240 RepID=UPI0028C2153B|nr:nuclear transport factor 2 family protein [Sphingopyxis sp. SE2]MDT7531208.1 nuclear transport factor 2 family protein [Sphingopyxis sp. SE2]